MRSLAFAEEDSQAAEPEESTLPTANRHAGPRAHCGRVNGRAPRIGLVGRLSRFGLGHQNLDIAIHLGIDRWLIFGHRDIDLQGRRLPCRVDQALRPLGSHELEAWMDGLDALLFVESPIFPELTGVAKSLGVCVVCVPNWEWLHPGLDWLDEVDLMLCPTRHTARLLDDWKQRFRFGWKTDVVAWPVDTGRHQFRRRYACRRFLFVNGSGGVQATTHLGEPAVLHRKGLDLLLAAAREIPGIPIIVYAADEAWTPASRNVEFRPLTDDNRQLYRDGDVCVQPSHWEGLGLPLLECQAAGMPLITTDLPPMNEHNPYAVVPATEIAADLSSELCVPAARIDPDDLARVLREAHGRNLFFASGRARRFVLREHSWQVARPRLLNSLTSLFAEGASICSSAR